MGAGASTKGKVTGEAVDASSRVEQSLNSGGLNVLVKTSWEMIPSARPPLPEGADPTAMPYAIPVTFAEMFGFNSMYMNTLTGSSIEVAWMVEAMPAFETVVHSIDDPTAFKTESKNFFQKTGASGASPEALDFFKVSMLASLRSCLPADWSLEHELAWAWFWESCKAHRDSVADESWLTSMLSCGASGDSKEAFETRRRTSTIQSSKGIIVEGQPIVDTVQKSYSDIPTEQPPCPEGEDPMMQVPKTFLGMASFNMMVVTAPPYYKKDPPVKSDMSWAPDALGVFATLVQTFGKDEFQMNCENLGVALKEKEVKAAQVNDFLVVILCSMRSLKPAEWSTQHEVAWRAFWQEASSYICPKL